MPYPIFKIDAANFQGELTDDKIAGLKAGGVQGVTVQAVTGMDGISYTADQLWEAKRAFEDRFVDCYMWWRPGYSCEPRIPLLGDEHDVWLDVEDDAAWQLTLADRIAGVWADIRAMEAAGHRVRGIYTRRDYWQSVMNDTTEFSDAGYELWDCDQTGDYTQIANFKPYGGWNFRRAQQYSAKGFFDGFTDMVDVNVYLVEDDVPAPAEYRADAAPPIGLVDPAVPADAPAPLPELPQGGIVDEPAPVADPPADPAPVASEFDATTTEPAAPPAAPSEDDYSVKILKVLDIAAADVALAVIKERNLVNSGMATVDELDLGPQPEGQPRKMAILLTIDAEAFDEARSGGAPAN